MQLIIKPVGSFCNLRCEYCFYRDKKYGYMTHATIDCILAQCPQIDSIVFSGGEPTLIGLPFFERLPKNIHYSLQTNGTILNKEWCRFLKDRGFLVGISIDGTESLHNTYRQSHNLVERAINLLHEYQIPFNVLVCVNSSNSFFPLLIYNYLICNNIRHIQFIPIVGQGECDVDPFQYGVFLNEVFNAWKPHLGKVFIQNFEQVFTTWIGCKSSLCVMQEKCGGSITVDYNGDVYSCEHFVEENTKLGNVLKTPIAEIITSRLYRQFIASKTEISDACRKCKYLFVCFGGCPKDRKKKENVLCIGYKHFFSCVEPFMNLLT